MTAPPAPNASTPVAPDDAAAHLSAADDYGKLGSSIGAQFIAGGGLFAAQRMGLDDTFQLVILGIACWAGLSTIVYTWKLGRRLGVSTPAALATLALALLTGVGIFLAAFAAASATRAHLRRQGVQIGWMGLSRDEQARLEAAAGAP